MSFLAVHVRHLAALRLDFRRLPPPPCSIFGPPRTELGGADKCGLMLIFPEKRLVIEPIGGLQVTSRRPCWWSRTKSFLSSGNLTLFSSKFFEKVKKAIRTSWASPDKVLKVAEHSFGSL